MAKKRKVVASIALDGTITKNDNKSQIKKRKVVASVDLNRNVTKYNTTNPTSTQQLNLNGSPKKTTEFNTINNNLLNQGNKNKLNEAFQNDVQNKIFEAAIGQNKSKIDLSGKNAQSTTPVTKKGLETQRNELMSRQELQEKRDKLLKELNNYDREEKVKWWDNDLGFGENLKNVGYKLIENQNTKYAEDEKYNELRKQFHLADEQLKKKKVEEKSATMSGLDKIAYTITGNVLDSTKGIESTVNKLFGQSTPVQSESFDEMMAEEARKQTTGLAGAGLDIVGSMSKMLPQMIVSAPINSSAAAMTVGFANYGGSAYNEAKQMGASEEQATLYGATIGGLETGLEKLLGGFESIYGKSALGNVTNKIMGKVITNTAFRQVASGMAGEFTEEYLQEFLQPIVKNAILEEENGADFWNAENLEEGVKQFISQLFNSQNLYAGTLGAVSSGLMSGPSAISQNVSINNEVKTIKKDINPKNIEEKISYLTNKGYDTNTSIEIVNKALKETDQSQIDPKIIENKKMWEEPTELIHSNNALHHTSETVDSKALTTMKNDTINSNKSQTLDVIENSKLFSEQIDDVINNKYPKRDMLVVTKNTPKVLQDIGLSDLPITMTQKHLYTMTHEKGKYQNSNYHNIDLETIKKLPEALERPLNVLQSDTKEDSIVVVTELVDNNDDIIVASIKIDGKGTIQDIRIDTNVMTSAYGKSGNYNYFMKDNIKKGNLLYDIDEGIIKKRINGQWLELPNSNDSLSKLDVKDRVQFPMRDSNGTKSISDIPKNISPISNNNDTIKTKKSQIAPISSQYSMQQNMKNDTKVPIVRENNEINERIEKDDTPDVITYKVTDKITRKQVRQQLLDEMDITAEELSIGDDINAINFQITDPIRVNEKVFGMELGKKINEATIEKTKHNTAEKTRWLNSERNDIKGLGIKPRSKESAAVQKYGEKQYVNKYGETVPYGDVELANEFSNTVTQEKIKRAAEVIRNKYDKYIDQINEVITALGYDEIPKRTDYMRHFQELGDIFSQTGVPFNLNDMKAEDLPTDINGLTEFNKPGKNWFASAQQRTGNKTTYDAITGIDGYLEGAGNLIYHTADIQRYRALSTLIRDSFGQTKGFENLDNLTNEQANQRIKDIQNNKFSKYAAWLDEQANSLAGKKGSIDRGVERMIGRKGYSFFNTLKKQVGSNMTGFNVRSALTNLISSTIASSKTNKIALAKGIVSSINNIFKNDSFVDKSDFLTSRFGSDLLSPKLWQKLSNAGQIFMTGTDYFTSNLIVRSKYYEGLQKGLSESEAIQYADDFGARVMGDRSQGSTAEIFNSKALGLLTQFQLEVNNQWQYMIHDTVMDYQKNSEINGGFKAGATALFQMGQLAVYSYLFNELFEALTGSRAAFDPIEILKKLFDDDDDKSWDEKLWSSAQEILDNLPMGNLISGTGNGRLPISSAIPITSIISGKDSNGYDKSRVDTILETLPYYVLPTGYSQAKKTAKGLSMFDKDKEITGSYTKSGNLRFPVKNTVGNKIQAGLFGEYSSKNAREYFDNDYSALGKNQQKMYKTLNIPISDYWEIRKEINSIKAELKGTDKSTEERKKIFYKYIDSLDVSNIKKSILKKSIYKSYDEADEEIKEYINSSNMSKQSKEDLLEELGLDK